MIVKIVKSVLLSYVLRRTFKEADFFICNKDAKEKQFIVCKKCCGMITLKLFRVNHLNPFCPFCKSHIDQQVFEQLYAVEDTQNEKNTNSNNSNNFEDLEYIVNNG